MISKHSTLRFLKAATVFLPLFLVAACESDMDGKGSESLKLNQDFLAQTQVINLSPSLVTNAEASPSDFKTFSQSLQIVLRPSLSGTTGLACLRRDRQDTSAVESCVPCEASIRSGALVVSAMTFPAKGMICEMQFHELALRQAPSGEFTGTWSADIEYRFDDIRKLFKYTGQVKGWADQAPPDVVSFKDQAILDDVVTVFFSEPVACDSFAVTATQATHAVGVTAQASCDPKSMLATKMQISPIGFWPMGITQISISGLTDAGGRKTNSSSVSITVPAAHAMANPSFETLITGDNWFSEGVYPLTSLEYFDSAAAGYVHVSPTDGASMAVLRTYSRLVGNFGPVPPKTTLRFDLGVAFKHCQTRSGVVEVRVVTSQGITPVQEPLGDLSANPSMCWSGMNPVAIDLDKIPGSTNGFSLEIRHPEGYGISGTSNGVVVDNFRIASPGVL